MTGPQQLDRLLVGLSISASPEPDVRERGLTQAHLMHAFVELNRHLLAAGASVAYGGDLREKGYQQILANLLHTYSLNNRPASDRVRAYLAWPIHQKYRD